MRALRNIESLNLLVQSILAALTALSVFFTWRVLSQSESQLALLRTQVRMDSEPYLLVAITHFESTANKEKMLDRPDLSVSQKQQALRGAKDDRMMIGKVTNVSSRIAHHVHAVVFDHRLGSFIFCEDSKEVLSEKQEETFVFRERYQDAVELMELLKRQYPQDNKLLESALASIDSSYIAVFYMDIDDRTYVCKRPFAIETTNSEIPHQSSTLRFSSK